MDLLCSWHGNKHNHVAQNNYHNQGNECWCMLLNNIVESLSWITYGGELISLQGGKTIHTAWYVLLLYESPYTRYDGSWFFLIIVHKRTSYLQWTVRDLESRQETTRDISCVQTQWRSYTSTYSLSWEIWNMTSYLETRLLLFKGWAVMENLII